MVLPTADPVAAEAQHQECVTATIAGREWRIPADADTWPLAYVLAAPAVNKHGEPVVNQAALLRALHGILGSQFREFVAAVPRRGDLVGASNTIAAAAGFPAGKDDRLFGSLPMTLALIAKWPSKVESDLNRFWGLDYCDRFRFDVNGNRLLTLRRIHTRLTNLPAESSLAIAMGKRTGAEILLMDVFKAIAGKDHPARPLTPEEAAQARSEQASISKAREEYRARRDREKNRRTGAAELARRNRAEQRQREGQINAEAS